MPGDTPQAFRILSLNGGGARGVFQARYLARLEEAIKQPLISQVDMVAATSTGAIVGLAVAAGVSPSVIERLYADHAERIFRPRTLAPVRRGPRYSTQPLESELTRLLGNKRVSDLSVPVVVPASTVDNYQPKVFSPEDGHLTLVDVALASAAAPTYFKPRRITGDQRAFYDGGVWANDPAEIGLSYARDTLGIDSLQIRMLMIGTGRVQGGSLASRLDRLRPLSLETLKVVYELNSTLQSAAVQRLVAEVVPEAARLVVNPELPHPIGLDDARASLEQLPGIADGMFDETKAKAQRILRPDLTAAERRSLSTRRADPIAVAGITEANLRTFIPARKFYPIFREGHGSISDYIRLAQREIVLVSVNLMTGESFEDVLKTFREMLLREDGRLTASISLLDPRKDYLLKAVEGSLPHRAAEIGRQIEALTAKATEFHASLPAQAARRFSVHWHHSLPSASAILSDPNEPDGRIQLETKAYKTSVNNAFGFEVGAGSDLFVTLREAYYNLIKDGDQVVPKVQARRRPTNAS